MIGLGNYLKKLFDFYIFSNIHVSIASALLVFVTQWTFNKEVELFYVSIAFFFTFSAYHFIRIVDLHFSFSNDNKNTFIHSNFFLVSQLLVGVIVGLFLLQFFEFQRLIILIPILICTVLYAIPVIKFKRTRINLRAIPFAKIFVIAFVWSALTVWFPVQPLIFESQFWMVFVQRFVFILAITIPFDIRDYKNDSISLFTLPQIIGVNRSKKLSLILLIIFAALTFMNNLWGYSEAFLSEILLVIISAILVINMKPSNTIYYTAFWIESLPIIWAILLIVEHVFRQ